MRHHVAPILVGLLPLLSACSSNAPVTHAATVQTDSKLLPSVPPATTGSWLQDQRKLKAGQPTDDQPLGDYAAHPKAQQFIDYMVVKHQYDRDQLTYWINHAQRLDYVLRLMDNQAPSSATPTGPNGAWLRYRQKFITTPNVQNGVDFWQEHDETLRRAQQQYGVPPEIIVGIIGVETRWGRVMGNTRLLDALATLAFDYPRRETFFTGELENFLLMAREDAVDAHELRGSFAGAMGYCQFMPSSFKAYAVDFNGDGKTDLWDPEDAIGSVANYFRAHGWTPNDTVAVKARGQAKGLEAGLQHSYPLRTLQAAGLKPVGPVHHAEATLLRLDVGKGYEYWYGLPNFNTITRYNRSVYYAMAVWQLGDAVKQQMAYAYQSAN
ncbi:lytic murein transglycosylase B [Pseudaeromonas paramecii]|uniref:Lytic murein transglycosylase B n=1 Tax=Pseudaeromonas paramecii TaxID=2138166 RepID=A0ABP8PUM8_9GAMM